MHRLLPIILIVSFGISPWVSAADSTPRVFVNTDVFELEVASDPQISPDGEQIVYVRRSNDIMVDRAKANIWIIDADGENHRPLLSGTDAYTSPRWSPSGDRLAYISSAEGRGPELYVRWMDTGQTALLSNLTESPGGISWSPDGQRIVLSSNRNADWDLKTQNSDLWSVSVATGEMIQLTDRLGPDYSPSFSPDGRKIAFLGYLDQKMGYHNTLVSVLDLDDGSLQDLTTNLDRSVDSVEWAGSSTRLIISYDDFGRKNVATLSMEGDVQSLAQDLGGVGISRPYTSGDFSVATNGSIAYTAGSEQRPAELAFVNRRGVSKLTNLNEDLLGYKTLASVEEISWRSSVGDHDVWGWLATPPDFDPDKKYPLILEIHGGPFTAYGPHFSVEVQLYAAAGYVVLYTNPRGSTSYGYDFANEIHHNYPSQDYDDLMSGVDAVIDRGFIDEEQLFVTGGSGGGVLTSWIVGNTDRFAAAVVAKPVINWASMTLYSDIPDAVASYWFEKPPWEDYESYWKRSPLSLVGNVSTPTMLLTGEADMRTPMPESEQYYTALKMRGIDTALVRVPESSHGIATRPSNQIAKVDNILAWFERYRSGSR